MHFRNEFYLGKNLSNNQCILRQILQFFEQEQMMLQVAASRRAGRPLYHWFDEVY